MAPPWEVLHTIDDLVRGDLQTFRDMWFDWLLRSAYLVIVGVVLEGPEVLHDFRNLFRKTEVKTVKWVKFVAFLGWIFIVVGVAGEGYFDDKLSNADTQLQAFNTSLLVQAQGESAVAQRQAANAIFFSGEASDSARQAQLLARGAREEADSFEKEIGLARKDAAEAQSHVAEALRQARGIEERLAWRTLTLEQQGSIRSKLSAFSGIVMDVFIWGDSAEIQNVSGLILDAVPRSTWTLHVAFPLGGGLVVRGILIGIRPGSDEKTVNAATALLRSLPAGLAEPWPFEKLINPGVFVGDMQIGNASIRVFIGTKP